MNPYYYVIVLMLVVGPIALYIYQPPNGNGNGNGNDQNGDYYRFTISNVEQYGFYYPITFTFSIAAGATDLDAWYSYDNVAWIKLPEKYSTDFFNGEDIVRFAYPQVYVSKGFCSHSNLYIKLVSRSNSMINSAFQNVAKYYDNRKAAVTSSHDDYGGVDTNWYAAMDLCQLHKVWFGCAIVTSWCTSASWFNLQLQINEGYVEPQGHSRTHPHSCNSYDEIVGCKNDILSNLNEIKFGRYVLVWSEPFGELGAGGRTIMGQNGYLYDRSTQPNSDGYISWDSGDNLFGRYGYSIRMGTAYGGTSDLATLNAKFQSVYNSGGVYHFMTHPFDSWATQPYGIGHIEFISGRNDVWYAPLGHIYAYRYVALFVQYTRL